MFLPIQKKNGRAVLVYFSMASHNETGPLTRLNIPSKAGEASGSTFPPMAKTGFLYFRAICATANGALWFSVCASIFPSPVTTTSAH